MEIKIKLKMDENALRSIEEALSKGKKVVIKIRGFSADLVIGPETNEELVYILKPQ